MHRSSTFGTWNFRSCELMSFSDLGMNATAKALLDPTRSFQSHHQNRCGEIPPTAPDIAPQKTLRGPATAVSIPAFRSRVKPVRRLVSGLQCRCLPACTQSIEVPSKARKTSVGPLKSAPISLKEGRIARPTGEPLLEVVQI